MKILFRNKEISTTKIFILYRLYGKSSWLVQLLLSVKILLFDIYLVMYAG